MLQKARDTYAFGRFRLDVAGYRLLCGGEEVRLEPKAFDLLLYFLENPGEVLSHREIKKRVWERDFVEDDSVYRKIADLRGVFRKYDPSCKYIRNIPGRGWRFEVGVVKCLGDAPLASPGGLVGHQPIEARGAELAGASACATEERPVGAVREDAGLVDGSGSQRPINNRPQVEQPVEQPAPQWGSARLVGIGALALAAAVVAVLVVPANSGPHEVTYRPLTRDGRPKEGPLASDGRYVYFGRAAGDAANGPTTLAAVPVGGGDMLFPANPAGPGALILDVARSTHDILYSGAELFVWRQKQRLLERAATTGEYVRISPDGRSIACATESERNGAIIIRDLADRPNVRRIPVSGIPRGMAWSMDGGRIRFPVFDPLSETAEYWEVRRDGSDPHRLPWVSRPGFDLRDGCWTADGRYFIYSDMSTSDASSSLWIWRENGAAGQGQPVKLTNNPMSFDLPATGSRGNTVFARGSVWKNQLDRYDASRGEFRAFWEDVAAMDVSFSNDGAWAAYRRATDDTLWISKSDGSERRQLTRPPLRAFQPHWSPDGRRVAFMGWAPNQPSRILIIGTSGGQPQTVKPGDSLEQGVPSWSRDGRYLAFGELRNRHSDDDMLIRLLDLKTGEETILPGSKGKWTPRWSPDGRYIVAVATNSESLALFDCARRDWTPLVTAHRVGDPVWSLDSRFVHFAALADSGRALFRVRIADAVVERLAPYPPSQIGWSGVAPDGSPLVLNSTRIEEIYAIDFK